jgi:hypothetical protein
VGHPDTVVLDGTPLDEDEVVAVARHGAKVAVGQGVAGAMAPARRVVESHLEGDQPVYGLTTGFGALADVRIASEDLVQLQANLVCSHAAGAGEPLPSEVVRAMMLLRARTLAAGRSGARPILVERIADLLNANITPAVPSRGSVGASGDLAQAASGIVPADAGRRSHPGGRGVRRHASRMPRRPVAQRACGRPRQASPRLHPSVSERRSRGPVGLLWEARAALLQHGPRVRRLRPAGGRPA